MNPKKPDDTENKNPWLRFGEEKEKDFVSKVAPEVGLDARVNPEKEDDPTAIDLLIDGHPTDLKTQETPFFTAEEKFGIPPQYCVTFNRNDYRKYKHENPAPDVLFWVSWDDEERYGTQVNEMEGVWRVSFSRIQDWVASGDVEPHEYMRRKGDPENANVSYGLNLTEMELLHCFTGSCR